LANKGRATQSTANDNLVAGFAVVVPHHANADIMCLGDGAVIGSARNRYLELAWQKLDFGMIG
jgi:tryptophan synthase alpha subunit